MSSSIVPRRHLSAALSFAALAGALFFAGPASAQQPPRETPAEEATPDLDPAALLKLDAADPSEGMAPRTPEQVISLAMAENPDLRAAILSWRQAKLSVVTQDYQFVPRAFGEVGYTTGRRPFQGPAGPLLLSSDAIRVAAGLNQTFRTATQVGVSVEAEYAAEDTVYLGDLGNSFGLGFVLQVAQPWLRGFGSDVTLAELHIAEIRRDSARAEQERRATVLARQVLNAYWNVWLAEQQIRINQSAMALANREMERAREQLAVGVISESELVPLMTELARIEEELELSRASRRDSQFQLASLLGQSPAQAGVTPADAPPIVKNIANQAELFSTAEERSYQLKTLKQNIEIARIQAAVAENRSLPDLSTNATVRVSGLGEDASQAFEQVSGFDAITAIINLRVELPIINRAAEADAERAQLGVEIAKANYQSARDQLQGQIAGALNNFRAAQTRLELAKRTAELAGRQVEIQSELFANGTTTMLDVVTALQQQNQARLRVARARIDILQLRLELEDAAGTLLERLSVEID